MSACVYASEEELWEDLLYYALTSAQRHRRTLQREAPGMPPAAFRPYQLACAQVRLHLYNLYARERIIPPILVEMARAEGVV